MVELANNLAIGTTGSNLLNTVKHLTGMVDEIRIDTRAMTADEIKALARPYRVSSVPPICNDVDFADATRLGWLAGRSGCGH